MDIDLKKQADTWANEIVRMFLASLAGPENPLTGESLDLYRKFNEWGWFVLNPLVQDVNANISTKTLLAIQKYDRLKYVKDHPPKNQPSKWEFVTGRKLSTRHASKPSQPKPPQSGRRR